MNQPHTVTVKILEKEYQVACPEEQEAELVVSAKYLDKQMRSIRETGKVIGLERIAVMARNWSGAPLRPYQASLVIASRTRPPRRVLRFLLENVEWIGFVLGLGLILGHPDHGLPAFIEYRPVGNHHVLVNGLGALS